MTGIWEGHATTVMHPDICTGSRGIRRGRVMSQGENCSRHIFVYVGKGQGFDEPIPRCVWRVGCTWSSCLMT